MRGGYGGGISAYCNESGTPLSAFNGHRIDCAHCKRPFRSFRAEETHCGCYRHLKGKTA